MLGRDRQSTHPLAPCLVNMAAAGNRITSKFFISRLASSRHCRSAVTRWPKHPPRCPLPPSRLLSAIQRAVSQGRGFLQRVASPEVRLLSEWSGRRPRHDGRETPIFPELHGALSGRDCLDELMNRTGPIRVDEGQSVVRMTTRLASVALAYDPGDLTTMRALTCWVGFSG